jgi:hypothetical protein
MQALDSDGGAKHHVSHPEDGAMAKKLTLLAVFGVAMAPLEASWSCTCVRRWPWPMQRPV